MESDTEFARGKELGGEKKESRMLGSQEERRASGFMEQEQEHRC